MTDPQPTEGFPLEEITVIFHKRQWRDHQWMWQAVIKLSGEIEGYTNSYSGKSWFVSNALQVQEAIDEAIQKARTTIQQYEES